LLAFDVSAVDLIVSAMSLASEPIVSVFALPYREGALAG
jgi:hypothetical protein